MLYADCPVCGPANLAAAPGINRQVFIGAVKYLHGKGGYNTGMLSHKPVKALVSEVNRSLSASLSNVETVVPPELLQKLKSDVFVFSGCKTEVELREASAMLLDAEGKPVEWNTFKEAVLKVHKRYNEHYLEAEYNFATQSAEMAARWADQAADGGRYNLQYRTAADDRVRESHERLNRTTLPATDEFWNSYYPPNGWRCRCTVVQVLKGKYPESDPAKAIEEGKKATTHIDKNGANRLEMFRFNPGKQAVIFPPHHPYRKMQEAVSNAMSVNTQWATLKTYKNGGKVESSELVNNKAADYQDIENCCNYFAKEGAVTRVYPKINVTSEAYELFYADLKGTKYWGKSPDFKVNNSYYELEGYTSSAPNSSTIGHMIKRGLKQSPNIVIKHIQGTKHQFYKKRLFDIIKEKKEDVKELWVLDGANMTLIYKKQ